MTKEIEYPENCIKVLDKGFVRLVDHMGDDSAIVQKARVSFGEGTKTVSDDKTLIRYLIRNRHTSPLEGVTFKFHIKAPLFCFRQWHRHRTWSYNEISGRYSKMKDEYYVPKEEHFTKQDPDNKQGGTNQPISLFDAENRGEWIEDSLIDEEMLKSISDKHSWAGEFAEEQENIRAQYERYLGTGVRRELARINLPLSQYSEMYATVSLHNLFHFLKLRMDKHAQFEIREFANALFESIKPIVPFACEAFEEYTLNSTTFHQKDLQAAYELIDLIKNSKPVDNKSWNAVMEETIDNYCKKLFSNKRERQESIEKMKKIFCYKPVLTEQEKREVVQNLIKDE
jgi:thymidylate synthase (FAD)